MLIPNHPHDERLSALASGEPDAAADAGLTEHVASCARCTDTVAELGALRASLAELPDLRPHRPLQLLPPVPEVPARADRVGGWAGRFFAPMLTAGAALALVGLVGTTVPILGSGASGGQLDSAMREQAQEAPVASDGANALGGAAEGEGSLQAQEPAAVQPLQSEEVTAPEGNGGSDAAPLTATDDRPLWPMLIFAGVAIMIAAALLRWILAPRAG
jgi:anti-sigma factor RsiW